MENIKACENVIHTRFSERQLRAAIEALGGAKGPHLPYTAEAILKKADELFPCGEAPPGP